MVSEWLWRNVISAQSDECQCDEIQLIAGMELFLILEKMWNTIWSLSFIDIWNMLLELGLEVGTSAMWHPMIVSSAILISALILLVLTIVPLISNFWTIRINIRTWLNMQLIQIKIKVCPKFTIFTLLVSYISDKCLFVIFHLCIFLAISTVSASEMFYLVCIYI